MSSSRPTSTASFNPDYATAPNTPAAFSDHIALGDSQAPSQSAVTGEGDVEHAGVSGEQEVPLTMHQPDAPGGSSRPASAAFPTSDTPASRNLHTPLPTVNDDLQPPRPLLPAASSVSTPRDSYVDSSAAGDSRNPLVQESEKPADVIGASEEHDLPYNGPEKRQSWYKRPVAWIAAIILLIVIVVAVAVPVSLTRKHSGSGSSAASSGGGSGGGSTPNPASPSGAITGGDGSVVTMENGQTFTYSNNFGGFWVADPENPFSNNAQCNSWTPPLNASWTWGKDKVYGVNLGGLFVLEPFISPALYQKYPGAVDEWTLSTLMAQDTASGGLQQIEDHYATFITEEDIAEIAGAGLNWIRLPIPFWAIETWPGEPFLAKTSWKYIVKVLGWARKYGLRVNLDLHTIPGSQNGFNHSGRLGQINFMNGVMGMANAQRALNYIRIITEFISQPEWQPVVPIFGIVNEARTSVIGQPQMVSFYYEAHNMIRNITGYGEGNGPYISIHDGFTSLADWVDILPGADRIILDTHPYFAFGGGVDTSPIVTGTGSGAGGKWPGQACQSWGPKMNTSLAAFGVTIAGEFSNGFNDCGLFVRGVNTAASYPDCTTWTNATNWDAPTKAGLQAFAEASMDALQDWWFWTWKVGNSTAGLVESPLWSYQLGLQNGWMPKDPRQATGKCAALGDEAPQQFNGQFKSWQTGGAGAGTVSAAAASSAAWPPATISNANGPVSDLPMYTSTGSVVTLSPPTLTATPTRSISIGDGWYDSSDTGSGVTVMQGCTYPLAWSASGSPVPSKCSGGNAKRAPEPLMTPAPPLR